MRKSLIVLFNLLIVGSLLTACGSSSDSGSEENDITIGTSPMGSGWYTFSLSMGDYWMDDVEGTNVNVQEGGSIGNLRGVNEGKDLNVGWTYTPDLNDALNNTGAFEEEEGPLDGVKVIALNYPAFMQIFTTADKSFEKGEDFLGSKVHAGDQGTGQELAFQRYLEAYDISYDDIKESGGTVSFGNYTDAGTQLQDGNIDVAVGSGAPDVSGMQQVENQIDLKVESIDQSVLDELHEKYEYANDLPLPENVYMNQDSEIDTIAYQSAIIVHDGLSEDKVYELTKSLWENIEELAEEHPSRGEYFDIETAIDEIDEGDVHPGALKYYKEQDVVQ